MPYLLAGSLCLHPNFLLGPLPALLCRKPGLSSVSLIGTISWNRRDGQTRRAIIGFGKKGFETERRILFPGPGAIVDRVTPITFFVAFSLFGAPLVSARHRAPATPRFGGYSFLTAAMPLLMSGQVSEDLRILTFRVSETPHRPVPVFIRGNLRSLPGFEIPRHPVSGSRTSLLVGVWHLQRL